MGSLIECRPVRLHYFLGTPNVGDLINPAIVTSVAGEHTVHAGTDRPHLLAIGSIMAFSNPHSRIWGTGVMHPDIGVGAPFAERVHAVRGKLTHTTLQQAGIAIGDIPFGDPAFLAPVIFGIKRSSTPKYKLGIVPHYVDRRNPLFRRLMSEPDVIDLDVHLDPEAFLRRMADCATVISSSLHGLVFAEALVIPNLWVQASDKVHGGTFKFDDWFSTTRHRPAAVHVLTPNDTVDDLIDRAAVHGSTIDVAALREAFPIQALDEVREAEPRRLLPARACRQRPTPVFLISFNRGASLERSINALKRQSRLTEIVVHDNGSTDPETITVLNRLEQSGMRVVRQSAIASIDDLNKVNATIQSFFADWAERIRYVVSDCGIDMTVAAPQALDAYDELLNVFHYADCVGPMLRIRDIPTGHPLFNQLMNHHIEHFWRRQPLWVETSLGRLAYLDAPSDTSLAMHRGGEAFFLRKRGLRVYEPYEARHLDWYLSPISDTDYTRTSNPYISHCNDVSEHARHKGFKLDYQSFLVVERNASGVLDVREARVALPEPCPIKPFAEASEPERQTRIVRIEALRRAGGSDVLRWQSAASHHKVWQSRGRMLADYVRPGERVFEFGAGINSAIPAVLPPGCTYSGSDVVPHENGIIVLDLNAPELPPLPGYDVAVFSGVLEYVHDFARLVEFLSRHFQSVVCSYAPRLTSDPDEIVERRYSGWFNDFTVEEFSAIFVSVGFGLSRQGDWAGQTLFRWDKRSKGAVARQAVEPTARILEQALATERDESLIARYTFQLAQSYRSNGEIEKALKNYLVRAKLGYSQEEVFYSLYAAAQLKEQLGLPEQEVIGAYLEAAGAIPTRAEALHGASRFCRIKSRHEEGFQLARQGLAIGRPSGGLFMEPWVYDYGLLDELAVNGYWSGHYHESLDACVKLLASAACPPDQRGRIAANARFAAEKLPHAPDLGSRGTEEPIDQPAALKQDQGNHRYWFYLAQSYRDAGRAAEAAQAYAKRAEMGSSDEEAWNARLQEARCLRNLGDEGGFVRQALAAFSMRPQRAEPLYDLARFYREKGMNDASVLFSEAGLTIKRPEQDILFLEDFVYTWGLQEEYSIAANYARDPVRKDRGFAACNWLALNRGIPDATRELAWSNLFFYVRPVGVMLPSFTARQVGFDPPDGYRPMNPSVTRVNRQIVIMLRTVNYELIEDGYWLGTPDDAHSHTRNFLLRVSDDLDIQSAAEVLPPTDMPEPASKGGRRLALGFEDVRLFAWHGELWGSANVSVLTPEAWSEQVLARVDELGLATCRLTNWRVLRPEGPRVHEKNWMPAVAGDHLQFIYRCDPTRVVDERGSTVTETTPAIAANHFSGGSQLVAFDGGWLALIHETQWRSAERPRFYQHRFVWFDETYTLRRVSRPFFFHRKGVEMAAGLTSHPDGARLLISYGVADSEAWIATVSAAEVRGVLEDAEHLPSGNSARGRGMLL